MIKLDIVNQVADKTGVPKQKAEQVVDSLFNAMKDALAKGKRIELRGFGVFVVKPRKRGVGRNPRTGKEVPIPAGKTIRFKPGKELSAKSDGLVCFAPKWQWFFTSFAVVNRKVQCMLVIYGFCFGLIDGSSGEIFRR